ncbi:hypothetical protein IQ241_13620 [Romeria aff. gracilis LEGE 07310]|uniref:Sulfotransferase family protein n=1 Tax=Vasconcelosia minhoensis LEGE 07310 TaxID=915328 RepID=A0A8J7AWB5_9CYAN|nr:sulfotransferase family protein [Romeria gracilis]MBE9078318.1 hypothetical protein [Romeria aff. gracilis LEGE 07310]
MSKVFGIGWAKTGTSTLGKCFEILGFDHQSQNLGLAKDLAKPDLSRIMALAQEKETFEDWPWIILYKELDQAFPGSRFILTQREPDQWIRSYKNMLANQGGESEELNEIRRILYGLPFPQVSREAMIQRYRRHNDEVTDYFRDRSDSLLVVNWGKGDGWKELCEFLDKPIPAQPFPHTNKGKYYRKTISSRVQNKLRAWLK